MPGGKDYRDGDSCEGKPGQVQVQVFASPTDTVGHAVGRCDPRNVPLQNDQLLTIAFLPKGATIPPPPAQAIYNLAAPQRRGRAGGNDHHRHTA